MLINWEDDPHALCPLHTEEEQQIQERQKDMYRAHHCDERTPALAEMVKISGGMIHIYYPGPDDYVLEQVFREQSSGPVVSRHRGLQLLDRHLSLHSRYITVQSTGLVERAVASCVLELDFGCPCCSCDGFAQTTNSTTWQQAISTFRSA
jgi:hypothetical protein